MRDSDSEVNLKPNADIWSTKALFNAGATISTTATVRNELWRGHLKRQANSSAGRARKVLDMAETEVDGAFQSHSN
eukprot:6698998-Pyramimonas_sp.AAC.1